MKLTEQLLSSAAGWKVFQEARKIVEAGAVVEARWEPPLLRGVVRSDGKLLRCGLKISSSTDIKNLCPCRDSQMRGILCAHSVAAGLQTLRAEEKPTQRTEHSSQSLQATPGREQNADETFPTAKTRSIHLEGSPRALTASFDAPPDDSILEDLAAGGFLKRGADYVLSGEEAVRKFYAQHLPKLEKNYEVAIGERFRELTKSWVRLRPRIALHDNGSGWLDFRIFYTAGADAVLSPQEIQRLLAGGQYGIRLRNGNTAFVDSAQLEEWEEVLRDCNPDAVGNAWKIQRQHAQYVLGMARELHADGVETAAARLSRDAEWKPGPLFSRLRNYQQEGARWMGNLALSGMGGLLADEMGLGKTVQTLAVLETLGGRRLVVCPSSLVWNWEEEARRFCPQMATVRLDGSRRENAWRSAPRDCLIITSYALLRRDVEMLREIEFSAVVLDEAQHIKNPGTQNAKAARLLRAKARFVLTGTPLENSLGDLWSLFEFLIPGFLGPQKDFQERYEEPLVRTGDASVWRRLRHRIGAYYLRRRKSEILSELPEKIERVIYVPLGPRQRTLYDQLQAAARESLDVLARTNQAAARMRAITALLRLRQCCCDIRLLGANPEGATSGSEGKIGALLELLEEARDGGHRVLVFSQFTAMLDLIEPALREAGHQFLRLDGTTKNRADVVREFQQNPKIGVFLISLKAGGVGLNLTAADTVIHFDPWWNPAVEAQATDRAHRIGQKRVVTVIKLIAAESVESKVLGMQEAKRELLAATLDSEGTAKSAFSEQDLRALLRD